MPSPLTTREQLAGIFDHTLVEPGLTTAQVLAGLELAKRCGVASATVRPCDIEMAARTLENSPVRPGSVVAFPLGIQTTSVKLYELRDLLRRGAREIDMVISIPRLVSREFQHVQTELDQAADECRKQAAILKIVLENPFLSEEMKIVACRCCSRAGVDFVAASGWSAEDLKLMRRHLPPEIGIKAAGGLSALDQVLEARDAGAARIGTSATAAILEEWAIRNPTPPSVC